MRINLGQYSLEVPEGFKDTTSYVFGDRQGQESLKIGFGPRSPEEPDLHTVLANNVGEVKIVFPEKKMDLGPETGTRIDGLEGRMISYSFPDEEQKSIARLAVAFPSQEEFVQFLYVTPLSDAKAAERFQQMLRSVVPGRRPVPEQSPAGLVRRWAGRLSLDVPTYLFPPANNTFERAVPPAFLQVVGNDPSDPGHRLSGLTEEIAKDSRGGTIIVGEQTSRALTTRQAQSTLVSYSLTDPSSEPSVVKAACRAHVVLKDGTVLHVFARLAETEPAKADAFVESVIQSMEAAK